MYHPYADLIGLKIEESKNGKSTCTLTVEEKLWNPNKVVHGGVLYALADTGMGAALVPTLESKQLCATIEIKINYFRPIQTGTLTCHTTIINKGKKIANLESNIYLSNKLVAKANGNFSIFVPSQRF